MIYLRSRRGVLCRQRTKERSKVIVREKEAGGNMIRSKEAAIKIMKQS
jgi:hypothetical protein